jgi:hypothetical protein
MACADALDVLRTVPEWSLPPSHWDQVQDAIAGMASAVAGAQPDVLLRSIGQLELCGPRRVATRLGNTPELPVPKAVRERTADLVLVLARDADLSPDEQPWLDPRTRS